MGCNFYLVDCNAQGSEKREIHIGKRSAAGQYCWDCNQTLCKQGEDGIHLSESQWFQLCPKCGKKPQRENIDDNSVGRELGFNKTSPQKKHGAASCSSFSWAIYPYELADIMTENHVDTIVDEYGTEYTYSGFMDVLSECPVQFFKSIGTDFC